MIVDTIAGLAEPTGLVGCPYHGIATGNVLPMPGGKQKSYPVRTPPTDVAIGRSRVIRPPWAKVKTLPLAMGQRGLSLQPYATINGIYSSLYGVELGQNNWLWAEAPGKVWLVDASELTGPIALSGKTFVIRLKRFGWIGGLPPDGEMQRTLTFSHFHPISDPRFWGPEPHIKNPDWEDRGLAYALADTHPVDGHSALFTIGTGYLRKCGVALLNLREQTLTLLAGDEVYWNSGVDKCEGDCDNYRSPGYRGHCKFTYDRSFIVGAGFSAEGQTKTLISRTYHVREYDVKGSSTNITWVEDVSGGISLESLDGDVYDQRFSSWKQVVRYVEDQDGNVIESSRVVTGTGLFGESLSDELYLHLQVDSVHTFTPWVWANAISYSDQDIYTASYLALSEQMVALVKYKDIYPQLLGEMKIIKVWRRGHILGREFTPAIMGNFMAGPHSWLFATFSSDPMTGEIMTSTDGISYRV